MVSVEGGRGLCAELVRAERFLRCNLLWPDERAAHNGPSPAHQASVEQVCSLEGDYNGFSADPARSFATAPPPPSPQPPAPPLHLPNVPYRAASCGPSLPASPASPVKQKSAASLRRRRWKSGSPGGDGGEDAATGSRWGGALQSKGAWLMKTLRNAI